MDVACPACAARYTADDEKLRGKTARMRCKACNTVWLVSGPGASASAPPMTIPPSMSSTPPSPSDDSVEKRAAVVKNGSEREKRDLFATREPDLGSVKVVKETLLPPPSFGFTATVGQRNETSVLFRVDQLAGAGGRLDTPAAAPVPASIAPRALDQGRAVDDEGVIDLKSLASVPPKRGDLRPIVAPLFSDPAPVTLEIGEGSSRAAARPIGRGRLFGGIAAAAVFVVLAGFGISFAFRGEEPVKHAAAAPAPPPPPPVPVATAPAAPTAEPAPAVASSDESASKPAGKRRKGAKSGAVSSKSPATTTAVKAPKSSDPCGCHGDFNCALACSAHGGK